MSQENIMAVDPNVAYCPDDPAVAKLVNHYIENSEHEYKGEPYSIQIMDFDGDEVLSVIDCKDKIAALKMALSLHGVFNTKQVVDMLTNILEEFKNDIESR